MNTRSVASDLATPIRTASVADTARDETTQTAADSYASWNSWGERNPFSMGSSGRF